jgi:uncharacterized protein YecE (DUF72 family)
MEFGKVTAEELDSIDFTLPPDPKQNEDILKTSPQATKIFVGCAKWGRKDWIGKIYPKGTKESDFLRHYGTHFNGIELNATFYRIPSFKQTTTWSSMVGDDFKFCPKFSGQISHIKRLKDVEGATERFLYNISGFGKKLGCVFLMIHPGMGPKNIETISSYLKALPKDIDVSVELRHKDWYEQETFESILAIMKENKISSVITDAAGRRDCVHMRLTTPTAFIRFVGNGLHASDYSRVDAWVDRMGSWMRQGIHNIYFFMHQQDEVHSPVLGKYVIDELNKREGTGLKVPQFVA